MDMTSVQTAALLLWTLFPTTATTTTTSATTIVTPTASTTTTTTTTASSTYSSGTNDRETELLRRVDITNVYYQHEHERDAVAAATAAASNRTFRRQRSSSVDPIPCKKGQEFILHHHFLPSFKKSLLFSISLLVPHSTPRHCSSLQSKALLERRWNGLGIRTNNNLFLHGK